MKLSLKLPLAFAFALVLLFLGGVFGISTLNHAVSTYRLDVLNHVDANKKAADIAGQFSVAIQEWKNVLLRGKTPKDLDTYWSAHQKEMAKVIQGIDALSLEMDDETSKGIAAKLGVSMRGAAKGYEAAFEAYKASDFDFAAGDKAARGKDREAASLLLELRKHLSEEEAKSSETASALAARGSSLAYGVMTLVTLIGFAGSIWMSRQIVHPLNEAVSAADKVSRGDLTTRLDTSGKDEISDLLRSLQTMQQSLSHLVIKVREGAESVSHASTEIAQGNHDLSNRTEQQATALQEAAASMDELGATVSRSADGATQANHKALQASDVAARGGEVVHQVVETMRGIHTSSSRIAEIISVIDGIAFQTNILALNAAVEAARAGEQGRGFAVVASEVRSLAGRSAEAAKEIKSLIGASVEQVELGSSQVARAGQTMNEVVDAIREVTAMVGEITTASEEQRIGVNQAGSAVTLIDQATQQNAALVEEMAAAASGLQQQAHDLVGLVSVFKTGSNTMQPAALSA
uniref:Methyl-accepting chemotaxis protein I n=1 Tax=Curvibacter symbiont subsp. Hydra magnipapillata TaxID=667019 RepID=C9YET4_CURXX|nr:Methyl-accepting chemotaxis protein I [Curvibacter putative symbiont of Hydra magnipapillata]